MAPAAVQTKQSVSAYSTSAPALRTHASMAGPLTPSRSPITRTRFPLSSIIRSSSSLDDEGYTVRRFRHAAKKQAPFRHEQRAADLPGAHRAQRVGQVANGRRDVPLGRRVSRHAVGRDELVDAVARDLAAHGAEGPDEAVVALRHVAA